MEVRIVACQRCDTRRKRRMLRSGRLRKIISRSSVVSRVDSIADMVANGRPVCP